MKGLLALIASLVMLSGTPTGIGSNSLNVPSNEWIFVAVTYDESQGKGVFYVNNENETFSSGFTNRKINTSAEIYMGKRRYLSSEFSQGEIDEVRVYNRVLSESEISELSDEVADSEVSINWDDQHQQIDGFGASSAWMAPNISEAQADMFFSAEKGIGLSLLRTRIAPNGTTLELGTMKKAQSRGAKVWSTPWSPPAEWKDNRSVIQGGHLMANHYNDYADLLADYVADMNAEGVTLYAISVQNEPDISADYESCLWSREEIHAFVPHLYAALAVRKLDITRILIAEDSNWKFDIASSTMNDPKTASMIGILGAHNYRGSPSPVNTFGKQLWQTEVSSFDSFDESIDNALIWATNIHEFMTKAKANAWHYWWLIPLVGDNEGLTDKYGNPTKRMWAIGNFSKFVRPGDYRIGTSNPGDVLVSAYKEPVSGRFAIVAINNMNVPIKTTFNFVNFDPISTTPWITSASKSLKRMPSLEISGGFFTYTLPALSIVTFDGKVQNTASGICGCGTPDTDSDGDGIPDCNDDCDYLIDTDGDGTNDCDDLCPIDPNKTEPGICCCGIADTDSDGDGTLDCNDSCPNDPEKAEPGICGCGVPDVDTDSDGTLDCNDNCPNDPNKTGPGVCGCGVADTDSDGDGIPDCNDNCDNLIDSDGDGTNDCDDLCPNDPNKTGLGICGCGVADTDTDSDGTPDCNDTDKQLTNIEAFVTRFYKLCLDRDPDSAGLDSWVTALLNGTQTGSGVANGFVFSTEFLNKNPTNGQYLQILYEAFFNRQPDPAGLQGWLDVFANGSSRQDVLNGFIYATEFNNLCWEYGISPNPIAAFVTRFYQRCLNRSPDRDGLDGWTNELRSRTKTGSDVARGFICSQEFINKNTTNEEFLTILYQAFFNRDPDKAGWDIWLDELNSGRDRCDLLNGFLGSQEFNNLCDDYGIIPF